MRRAHAQTRTLIYWKGQETTRFQKSSSNFSTSFVYETEDCIDGFRNFSRPHLRLISWLSDIFGNPTTSRFRLGPIKVTVVYCLKECKRDNYIQERSSFDHQFLVQTIARDWKIDIWKLIIENHFSNCWSVQRVICVNQTLYCLILVAKFNYISLVSLPVMPKYFVFIYGRFEPDTS